MAEQNRTSLSSRFFTFIERTGNKLPNPAILFALLGLLTLLFSWIGSLLNISGLNPVTGETIYSVNLLSVEGLHRIILEFVDNYTGFAPLGIVMVALMGIGVAESSGLMKAAISILVTKAPMQLITFIIVLSGILSNAASDLGYILIIPLGGIIFHTLGRHPIAGMSAAFAGVSGGFSANIFIGTIDPLLAGLSTEAAKILDPQYYVLPTANYYFMFVSTFVIAFGGTWVTKVFVEPRLGKYEGNVESEQIKPLTSEERRGLKWVFVILLAWMSLFAAGLIPDGGFLRGSDNTILHTPLLKGFIFVLFITAVSVGYVFGRITGKFKNSSDIINSMSSSFKGLVSFLVLVFFASQFVAWFKWSNLGLIFALNGASWLQQADIGLIPLLIMFIIFTGFVNLFMGSASAKWAIMAPVFIPMFMLLGYSPELSQAVFRIGDSVTNIISPMMSFFALIVVYYQKYDPNAGLGTIISTMLPYSIAFFFMWTLLIIIWVLVGLPLGPDSGMYYPRAI